MSDFKLTDPQGNNTYAEADNIIDLLDEHPMVNCIMAACPDAAGWVLTNLTTGTVTDVDKLLAEGY